MKISSNLCLIKKFSLRHLLFSDKLTNSEELSGMQNLCSTFDNMDKESPIDLDLNNDDLLKNSVSHSLSSNNAVYSNTNCKGNTISPFSTPHKETEETKLDQNAAL